MQTKMVVTGLTIDSVNNAPIVILREEEGSRILPIWIGVIEASAIAFELEKVHLTRPMTHDLLKSAIEALNGTVQRVTIVDLRDNTYFAMIVLVQGDKLIEMDARPSDAIALALRFKAPIFCEAKVIEQAHQHRQESVREAEQSDSRDAPQEVAYNEGEGVVEEDPTTDDERGSGGPTPIVDVGSRSMQEILESLEPKDFGKYKM